MPDHPLRFKEEPFKKKEQSQMSYISIPSHLERSSGLRIASNPKFKTEVFNTGGGKVYFPNRTTCGKHHIVQMIQ